MEIVILNKLKELRSALEQGEPFLCLNSLNWLISRIETPGNDIISIASDDRAVLRGNYPGGE